MSRPRRPSRQTQQRNYDGEHAFLLVELYATQELDNKGYVAAIQWREYDWRQLLVYELGVMPQGMVHLRTTLDERLFQSKVNHPEARVAWQLVCSDVERDWQVSGPVVEGGEEL
jgi:hypothetical protein